MRGADKSASSLGQAVQICLDLHREPAAPRHRCRACAHAVRIRWRIFSMLFGFGFVAYLQQKSITVVAPRSMMPELHLSQFQISSSNQAFVVGYALFQLPGGIFGQRQGARRTFVIIGLPCFLATIAMPLAPYCADRPGVVRRAAARSSCCSAARRRRFFRCPPACSRSGFRRAAGLSCRGCRPWAWARRGAHAAADRLAHGGRWDGSGRCSG
jgi:hypothetical protein